MKKFLPFLLLLIIALSSNSTFASGRSVPATNSTAVKNNLTQEQVNTLVARIYEIRDISKKDISTAQKRELRNEVLAIKAKLSDPGVYYISGGALILIIILLIILL